MNIASIFDKMVKPSTRAFWKEARERPGGTLWEAVHGLIYLKWPEFYISVGLGRGRLSKVLHEPAWRLGKAMGVWGAESGSRFADTYHGKVMPLRDVSRLIRVERPLYVDVPEAVLPYSKAREIILENPEELVLLRCPCRATADNPCQPLDVCIIVGQPIVGFVLEHHPDKCRRVTVDEAVEVVVSSQKRGHVSHAFFKEAVLGRYYAICNCCSCCCGAMQAHKSGTPMLAPSGFLAELDEDACINCGKCVKMCPFSAITAKKTEEGKIAPAISADACFGCGVCSLNCPSGALRLVRDESGTAPLADVLPLPPEQPPRSQACG